MRRLYPTTLIFLLLTSCFAARAEAQSIIGLDICSPPGAADGNTGSFYSRVVNGTGLVYVSGSAFGGTISVYDPSVQRTIAEVPFSQANGYTGGSSSLGVVNQQRKIIYFLMGTNVVVVDGRPESATFNQTIAAIPLTGQIAITMAIDDVRDKLYISSRIGTQSQIATVDVNPASGTFNQVVGTAAFPAGNLSFQVAVNKTSNKIYATSTSTSAGVYVMAGGTNTLNLIAGTTATTAIGINETSNTIYATRNGNVNAHAINGVTDTLITDINIGGAVTGSSKAVAVNLTTERVSFIRTTNIITIDAKASSPTFNTVVQTVPLPEQPFEIAISPVSNRLVAVYGTLRTSVVDLNTAVVTDTFQSIGSSSVSINPHTEYAFVAYQLGNLLEIRLTGSLVFDPVNLACEIGDPVANPNNGGTYLLMNRATVGLDFLDSAGGITSVTGLPHSLGRWLFAGINKTSNRIFALNSGANIAGTSSSTGFVSVVDGSTNNVLANVATGNQPFNIGVNEVTNKAYLMNVATPPTITVVDGNTFAPTTVTLTGFGSVGSLSGAMVANPVTNRIYFGGVANPVGVLNGVTNTPTSLPITNVSTIEVNSSLNRIYFLTNNALRVLDGANDAELASIPLSSPTNLVVNPTNGRVYVFSSANKSLTVIDGNLNTQLSTVTLPHTPSRMAIDTQRNRLFIASNNDLNDETNSYMVFVNGDSLAVDRILSLSLRPGRMAFNPTNRKIYVTTVNAPQRSGVATIQDYDGYTPFDYDGDGKSDISVWRPSNGTWYVGRSGLGDMYVQPWGLNGDTVVPADYDGDGKTDLAVRRPSDNNFYVFNSSNSSVEVRNFGIAGDIPIPSDYNGDGKADVAVWRPSNGTWYLSLSGSGIFYVMPWGLNSDKPAPADFDGDGKTELVVFRPSDGKWYMFNTVTGTISITEWGLNGDRPVPGDYNGDGRADFAVYRPSNNTWYRQNSNDGGVSSTVWGLPNDFPVPGDYDGDGKIDIAVWRPSDATWYINRSGSGFFTQTFGQNGDTPTPSAFVF